MIGRSLSRFVAALVVVVVAAGVGWWQLDRSGALSGLGELTHPRQGGTAGADSLRRTTQGEEPERAESTPAHKPADPLGAVREVAAVALVLAALLATPLAAGATAVTCLRLRARSRRRYRRYAVQVYRAEEADAERVRRLVEAIHQILLERWYRRLLFGQPGLALEAHAVPHESGTELRLSVAVPEREGLAAALNGLLAACYRDSRLVPGSGEPPWTRELVRLKRRYPGFGKSLAVAYERRDPLHVMDALVATMQGTGRPCTVQLALVPTPALFDRLARRAYKARERDVEARRDAGEAGVRSELERQEFSGSAEGVQNRPLFFCDLRVAADDWPTVRSVAGALKGASAADNRLVERRLRGGRGDWLPGRRPLYARRLRRGESCPLPAWRKGVYSSAEVAALWHLPSPFLKSVTLARSSVPRVPAPPQVLRVGPERALLCDEHGRIGMRAADRPMNVMLLGNQGTGKTSLMCRLIAADALDPNCALVVLDGKSDLAFKALSVIPPELPGGRRVHFLDFAHPGVNPFAAGTGRDETADALVEAFKAITSEGGIRESSERYLHQAALAAMAWAERTGADGGATLWDLWALLLPGEEAADFRREVVRAISDDPDLAAPAYFFGRQLPEQLRQSPGMMTTRLDAPVNKLQTVLGKRQLDAILRHPHAIRIDELIARRDVLVVSGSVGAFGEGAAVVLLQIVLHMVHRAVIRQQAIPEEKRARVSLAVDEAHLLFSDTFARMLAMDRSAGLECVSAWQSLGQIEDPNLRRTILNLHRQRSVFSLADQDAEQMTAMLQTAYASVIRDDPEARQRMRISPDALMHLPNYRAACSWISDGERVPSFVAQTLPMEDDPDRIALHLERQRERGARYPGTLPPPERTSHHAVNPDIVQTQPTHPGSERKAEAGTGEGTERKPPDEAQLTLGDAPLPAGEAQRASAPVPSQQTAPKRGEAQEVSEAATPPCDFEPDRDSYDDSRDKIGVAPLGSHTGVRVPDSYAELVVLDDVEGLRWDQPLQPPAKARRPQRDELEILAALYELRFLLSTQIGRRLLPTVKERTVQHRLAQMRKQGWIRRGEFKISTGGGAPRVYALAKPGYELLQKHRGVTRIARDLPADDKWRESEVRSPLHVVHDVHAAAWLFALERELRDDVVRAWWGPFRSALWPPSRRERGEWVRLRPDEIRLGQRQTLDGLQLDQFEPVKPDVRVELDLSLPGQPRRVDLLVELDRTGRASSNAEKFRRYDALLSGWALQIPRYRTLGEAPIAVFVVEQDDQARRFLELADKLMTGRVTTWGKQTSDWPHYGRRRLFVVAERDLHVGALRALRLPEQPPELRRELGGRRAERLVVEQVPRILPRVYAQLGARR